MSEKKTNPALDENTFDKLLEAAYVRQEHNRKSQALESGLQKKRAELEAQDKLEADQKEAKDQQGAKKLAGPKTPASKVEAAQTESVKTPASQTPRPADYTVTLSRIVETQRQIQVGQLALAAALSLVTERTVEISGAAGVAIGIVEGGSVRYRATAGSNTIPAGTSIATQKALCAPCLKTGQVFRCDDVLQQKVIDTGVCRERGIQSLIVAPIFQSDGVAGGLELYYEAPNAFTDQDVHSCQLMAGLVTESLARDKEQAWKQSLASERATMLEALERLKPNLDSLAEKPADKNAVADASNKSTSPSCQNCGHVFLAEEQFCGGCGLARTQDEPAHVDGSVSSTRPTKNAQQEPVPSLTLNAQFKDTKAAGPEVHANEIAEQPGAATELALSIPPIEIAAAELAAEGLPAEDIPSEHESASPSANEVTPEEDLNSEPVALEKSARSADWSSAASARDFLEQLASNRTGSLAKFWDARRGDIYLAISMVLVVCVILFGVLSNHGSNGTGTPAAAASTRQKAADADLSLFDRLLIRLGLAEAPETTPSDKGNPGIQVWVDQRTALYYCPGSDLYGKTPKGRYTSQREAQLDQFEPAYRKVCE